MVHTHGDANGIVQDRMEEEVRIVQYQVGIHLHAIDSSLNSKSFPSKAKATASTLFFANHQTTFSETAALLFLDNDSCQSNVQKWPEASSILGKQKRVTSILY